MLGRTCSSGAGGLWTNEPRTSSGPAAGPTHERRHSRARLDPRPAGLRPAVSARGAGAPARVTRRAGAQRRTAEPLTRAGVEATRLAGAESATAGCRGPSLAGDARLGDGRAVGFEGEAQPPLASVNVQH